MLTSKHFFNRHALHWFLCVLSTGQPPWNRVQVVSGPRLWTGDSKPVLGDGGGEMAWRWEQTQPPTPAPQAGAPARASGMTRAR